LIFNPGLSVLGGGERYMAALGTVIAETHQVVYAAPTNRLPEPGALARFDFPPLRIAALEARDLPKESVDYDLSVVIETWPPKPAFAAHNLLIVQFPFKPLPTERVRRALARHYLARYHRIVYSDFARSWLLKRWEVNADILNPGVEIPSMPSPLQKDKLILAVGRFFSGMHCKRQDVLIEAFARLPESAQKTWQLVLVGGYQSTPKNQQFVERLMHAARNLNVSIEPNASAGRLMELQNRARFFWHATGFGREPDAPEQAEHFGLSTVEAMSHGAIPLVFADGGQLEVVTPKAGLVWTSIPELVDQTSGLIACSKDDLDDRSRAAYAASRSFSMRRFEAEARTVLARAQARPALPVAIRRVAAAADRGVRRVIRG
jgi:glycosyltransferase involved in cell wall biosynthesis